MISLLDPWRTVLQVSTEFQDDIDALNFIFCLLKKDALAFKVLRIPVLHIYIFFLVWKKSQQDKKAEAAKKKAAKKNDSSSSSATPTKETEVIEID